MITTFRALRYDDPHSTEEGVLEVDNVIAPIAVRDDAELRAQMTQRSTYNIANALSDELALEQWEAHGWLRHDTAPAMYLYKIGFTSTDGQPAQWSGVFARIDGHREGADRQIVPQRIDVSAEGFSELLRSPLAVPLCRATDDRGAHHRLWAIEQPGIIDLIADAVAKHGQPRLDTLEPGALILAGEATQANYDPALGLIMA